MPSPVVQETAVNNEQAKNRSESLTMLLSFLKIALTLYVILALLLFALQKKLIFFPTSALNATPAVYGWDFQQLSFPVGDSLTCAWFIPAATKTDRTILFSHGNAGNRADRLESVSIFRDLGFNTLIYDYGGYADSTGPISEQRCYDDARAAWKYLIEDRQIAPTSIVLFGRSLGGGVTTQLATEVDAGAVILESTFISIPRMAQDLYPIFPATLFVRHRFNNADKVANIEEPILHIHSSGDDLIPFKHGQALFAASSEPKEFLELHGTHNDGFIISGQTYTNGLAQFLAEYLEAPPESPSSTRP